MAEQVKQFNSKKSAINAHFGEDQDVANLVQLCNAFTEARNAAGSGKGTERLNEPLLIVPTSNIQKNLEYEHLKYTTSRDPSSAELIESA